ncbi:MAG: hypothetical protein ACRC2J_10985 [Microcoleaceae cyanobacterium]
MTYSNSSPADQEWAKQVEELLEDIARSYLATSLQLSDSKHKNLLPLAKYTKNLIEQARQSNLQSHSQQQYLIWLESVYRLLMNLSFVVLSDNPKLPESMGEAAVQLSKDFIEIKKFMARESVS